MAKKTRRPGRGTKGAHNPMLHDSLQGHRYIVKRFVLVPEVTLLDADGHELKAIESQVNLRIFETMFGKTVREIMETNGLQMEGGKP